MSDTDVIFDASLDDNVIIVDDGNGVIQIGTPLPETPPTPTPTQLAYLHTQVIPATVWTITHNLGFDPAGIVVIDNEGFMRDGFAVQYLDLGVTLRLSFDISLAGTARLS